MGHGSSFVTASQGVGFVVQDAQLLPEWSYSFSIQDPRRVHHEDPHPPHPESHLANVNMIKAAACSVSPIGRGQFEVGAQLIGDLLGVRPGRLVEDTRTNHP
ncbi:MAG: hypothetical protein WKF79_02660 [Nocardioides sp.]